MLKTIKVFETEIVYELHRKNVKNINLRVRQDGTVYVSANSFVPQCRIDEFIRSNAGMIVKALERYRLNRCNMENIDFLPPRKEREKCRDIIVPLCLKYYPVFSGSCGAIPEIKLRKMKSRWGSCRPTEKILTFNTRLAYVPQKCAEYVVVHEFAHFVHPDHSKAFYAEVEKHMPNWRKLRAEIRKYETLLI